MQDPVLQEPGCNPKLDGSIFPIWKMNSDLRLINNLHQDVILDANVFQPLKK
jgi:hypothetical protein